MVEEIWRERGGIVEKNCCYKNMVRMSGVGSLVEFLDIVDQVCGEDLFGSGVGFKAWEGS